MPFTSELFMSTVVLSFTDIENTVQNFVNSDIYEFSLEPPTYYNTWVSENNVAVCPDDQD